MTVRLYTVGHSLRPLEDLVDLCRGVGVGVVADIRRFPRSRRNPPFARAHLEERLPDHGLDYVWLGETLGGYRSGGYDDWMRTEAFQAGIAQLEALAADRTVAFMCAEADPARCHRRFVAEHLVSRGHPVAHLLHGGVVVPVQAPL